MDLKKFYAVFSEFDKVNLPRYSFYMKLMIDGETSTPFNAIITTVKYFDVS